MSVTKEDILEYIWGHTYKPMLLEELAEKLNTKDYRELASLLGKLEAEGLVVKNRKGRYGLPQKMNLRAGRIQGNAKGFAFLIPDDPAEQDIFILSEDLNGAMHNDRVIVRLYRHMKYSGKREGKVIRILSRANEHVVGTFEETRGYGFVVPDEKRLGHDIFIAREMTGGARHGDKVVVEIISWPGARRSPEGKVIEVLGQKNDPGTDILSIVRKYQLPGDFPADVLREAESIPFSISAEEAGRRKDLRGLTTVTIDGEDAKDLDDAVSLEMLANGNYRLGVHIADVGYYVREGSLLDEEALKRATSVYLVDRVIPMLPPRLSNGICSLNAGEDRLTLSCLMEIDKKGETVRHEICRSIIRVKERLTYTAVRKILIDGDEGCKEHYESYIGLLDTMRDLCLVLRQKRFSRGAIDFEIPEAKVILDGAGRPVNIVKRENSIAEMIIEEFMIAANETVATQYFLAGVPFLYRIHEEPDYDDVAGLNDFLGVFGYYIKLNSRGEVTPRAYQQVVERVKGRPEERAVAMTMLRSMKHARYATEAIGHFGLACRYYTHFTAPIRRYPDLAIHRVIGELLDSGLLKEKRRKNLQRLMGDYAKQSSLQEKVAEDAERESTNLKKVEYMKEYIGHTFTGFISGVQSFGFFVELPNTVEGLVHVSTLDDDYYIFDDKYLALVGEHTKRVFRIGDTVDVLVSRVDVEQRRIDFELVPVTG